MIDSIERAQKNPDENSFFIVLLALLMKIDILDYFKDDTFNLFYQVLETENTISIFHIYLKLGINILGGVGYPQYQTMFESTLKYKKY